MLPVDVNNRKIMYNFITLIYILFNRWLHRTQTSELSVSVVIEAVGELDHNIE